MGPLATYQLPPRQELGCSFSEEKQTEMERIVQECPDHLAPPREMMVALPVEVYHEEQVEIGNGSD
jgi:hypothetical protein